MATAVKKLQTGAEAIAESLQTLNNMLKNGMDSARDFFETKVVPGVQRFTSGAAQLAGKVGEGVVSGLKSAGSFIADKTQVLGDYLKDKAQDAGEFIRETAQHAGKVLREKAHDAKEFIKENAEHAKEYLKDKAHDAREFIQDKAHDAGVFIKDKAQDAREFIKDKAHDAGVFIKDKAQEFGAFVSNKAQQAGGFVKDNATALWDKVKEQAPLLINNARNKVQQWIQTSPEKFQELKQKLEEKKEVFVQKLKENKEKIQEWYNKAKENFPRINFKRDRENTPEGTSLATSAENATSIDNALNNDRKPLLPIVREKIQAIKETLSVAAQNLKDKLSQMRDDFKERHPNIREELGEIASGIAGVASNVGNSISNSAKKVKQALENAANKIKVAAQQIKEDAMDKINQIKENLQDVPEEISALAGQFRDFVRETMSNIRDEITQYAEQAQQSSPTQEEPNRNSNSPTTKDFMDMEWEPVYKGKNLVGAQLKDPAMRTAYTKWLNNPAPGEARPKTPPHVQKYIEFKENEKEQELPQEAPQEIQQEVVEPQYRPMRPIEEMLPHINTPGAKNAPHLSEAGKDEPIQAGLDDSSRLGETPVVENPVLRETTIPQDMVMRISVDPELKQDLTGAINELNTAGRLSEIARKRAIAIIKKIQDQIAKNRTSNLPAKGHEKTGMTNYSAGVEIDKPILGG